VKLLKSITDFIEPSAVTAISWTPDFRIFKQQIYKEKTLYIGANQLNSFTEPVPTAFFVELVGGGRPTG